jgi:ribosome-binding protein aMBF1 (putative translation factor)
MKASKRRRLQRAGWTVGSAAEFLGLAPEEQRFIEMKLALADAVRRLREREGLTQAQLARRFGSSQSRVAKTEAADPSVSLDLLVRWLLGLGATREDVARLIRRPIRSRAA